MSFIIVFLLVYKYYHMFMDELLHLSLIIFIVYRIVYDLFYDRLYAIFMFRIMTECMPFSLINFSLSSAANELRVLPQISDS